MRKFQPTSHKGRIVIQWMLNGQRYSLYGLGNADSHADNARADQLCNVIYSDILEGRFDTTLATYRQGLGRAVKRLGTPVEMFRLWVEHLKPSDKTFRVHYEPVLQLLIKGSTYSFNCKPVIDYWEHLAPSSYNGRISYLKSFGKWLVSEGYLPLNPYRNLKAKTGSVRGVQPFSATQVRLIIEEMYNRNGMVGAYYEFLFLTGCRPSEAIGLLKSKFNTTTATVTIDSVLARSDTGSATAVGRVRKETKTGDVRVLPYSYAMQLCYARAVCWQEDNNITSELVFCNSKGNALDDTNLCDRYWKPCLAKLGIPYQRPYITRHTAASTVIENGGTLADAAKLLGHRDLRMVSTIYGKAVKDVQLPSY